MAVTSTPIRSSVYIKLTDDDEETLTVSLGALNPEAYDSDKAMNIIEALESCFEYVLSDVQHVTTSKLKKSA